MTFMRLSAHGIVCALLAPACAAPGVSTGSSSTLPSPAIAHVESGLGAGPSAVQQLEDGVYHPPYSMMFRQGHTWTMPVIQLDTRDRLAMNESRPLGPDAEVICKVDHVDQFCDRRISNITCDGAGSSLLAGAYSATFEGMWKSDFAGSDTQLDDNAMMIARHEPFTRSAAKTNLEGDVVATVETQPWGAAWCVTEVDTDTSASPAPSDASSTSNRKMICLQPGRGLIGGRDAHVAIGDVPRVD